MLPKDQDKLFGKIRRRFKKKSVQWCSGYLHGILDEQKQKHPDRACLGTTRHDYNTGYIYGFIDARGTDVEQEVWYKRLVEKLGQMIKPRCWWWLR